jgi:hypothetical protein
MAVEGTALCLNLESLDETSPYFRLPDVLIDRDASGATREEVTTGLVSLYKSLDELADRCLGIADEDLTASRRASLVRQFSAFREVRSASERMADLLMWSIGVAFGRFDWRLAIGERGVLPEPDPFDPLPVKSPGMLPDGAASFHAHAGILVDDPGHPHDLARLVEAVLEWVNVPVPNDVRRWLQRELFPFHLQRYSKSRRKAPIYWPLATESGSYTLWIYYPTLSDQTLYRAVNDFVEPKLKEVKERATQLRSKGGGRSRDDEREFEELESLEVELTELRDSLLKIAKNYHPNQDDGVQLTAAPLWPLFRHKPWKKVLKDTWAKLEKGEYDWAHLAMSYWPARVREKCKTDKSLAIAHELEDLYVEPANSKKKRGKRKSRDDE